MVIEFTHIVSLAETNDYYLNLKDVKGTKYGKHFPLDKTPLVVYDQDSRRFYTKKHLGSQLWRGDHGGLGKWFEANNVGSGTRVIIRHDPDERTGEGEHVVRLLVK